MFRCYSINKGWVYALNTMGNAVSTCKNTFKNCPSVSNSNRDYENDVEESPCLVSHLDCIQEGVIDSIDDIKCKNCELENRFICDKVLNSKDVLKDTENDKKLIQVVFTF